ncbi:hypothetical protein ACUN0C_16460 [Faunimonas sp. B44]|uniref:hypothetical protein n=1 Tax=Faunimonas sp. B44 TaxID=3461493 RepID=UPI004044FBD6
MSGFSRQWLDLREPADRAARDEGLLRAAAALVARADDAVVLDLGSGTGATARALGPYCGAGITWRFVDHDPDLLREAGRRTPGAATFARDLARLAPDGGAGLPLDGVALVTASALFDLVSDAWVEALVSILAAHRLPLYAALTYTGAMALDPGHPLDERVGTAFNADQREDKGFGPALGPEAADVLARALRRSGYSVRVAASPWILGAGDLALTTDLLRGVAGAARSHLDAAGDAELWLSARLASAPHGTIRIGHQDLLAVPR